MRVGGGRGSRRRLGLQRYPRSAACARNLPKSAIMPNLLCLPDEILLSILRRLHIKDLLNICSTNSHFHDLIRGHASVWTSVSFAGVWPIEKTIPHFNKAVSHGNIEAAIKLGIAYLYNEGLPGDFEGKRIRSNGERAASMFYQVESLAGHTPPFTWLFIRPPWTTAGACCKEYVFNNMKTHVEEHKSQSSASACVCIARTLELLDAEGKHDEMMSYLQRAVDQGSSVAAYGLWRHKYDNKVLDRADELQSLRDLRHIAGPDCLEAQLELCQSYAMGRYGGRSQTQAAAFVRTFVQDSKPTNLEDIFRNKELTHSMRYILVDWLIEVASMKDFSTQTLHIAISILDRFLRFQPTTRSRLQLLGVSAMVLSSRLLGREILTIREAAWLTDNTYKYEDVVRMMGEITAVLKGQFRIPTSLDYVDILGKAIENDRTTQLLAEYLCEHCLLLSCQGDKKASLVGASCVYLARIFMSKDNLWPSSADRLTGFSDTVLISSVIDMHKQCFYAGPVSDHRNVVLQAVKQRYSDDKFGGVSNIRVPTIEDVCQALEIVDCCDSESYGEDSTVHPATSPQTQCLIMSPSRRTCPTSPPQQSKTPPRLPAETIQDRQKAATPTIESTVSADRDHTLDESTVSGYDGDKEDEGESMMDADAYDSDPDLESLWCADQLNSSTDRQSCEDLDTSNLDDSSASLFNFSKSLASFSVSTHSQPTSLSVPALGFHMQQVSATDNINLTPTPTSQSLASLKLTAAQSNPHVSQSAVSMTFDAGVSSPEPAACQSKSRSSASNGRQLSKAVSVYKDTLSKKACPSVTSAASVTSVTRSPRSPRLALHTLNTNTNTPKSGGKRKSPQQLGSENKLHIGS